MGKDTSFTIYDNAKIDQFLALIEGEERSHGAGRPDDEVSQCARSLLGCALIYTTYMLHSVPQYVFIWRLQCFQQVILKCYSLKHCDLLGFSTQTSLLALYRLR